MRMVRDQGFELTGGVGWPAMASAVETLTTRTVS
jgi:hypothetical protein